MKPIGPGRPRNQNLDQKILAHASKLLLDLGFDGMSMDLVAFHAGVSKPSIYRRWQSKEEMVVDALAMGLPAFKTPKESNFRDELSELIETLFALSHPLELSLLAKLADVVTHRPEIGVRYDEKVVAPRRQAVRTILERASARGEIDSKVSMETLVDMIVAPIFLRIVQAELTAGHSERPEWTRQVVEFLAQAVEVDNPPRKRR